MTLASLRRQPWPFWLLLCALLAAFAVWLHFVGKLGVGGAAIALFGISLAWAAAVAAVLGAVGALVELALRRPSTLATTRFPALLLIVEGAGFLIAMSVPLVGRFSRGPLILAIAGLLLFAFGLWRRRLPYHRALYPFLHLGLVILAFAAPREAGQFFFRWAHESTQKSYRWSGSEACHGQDAAGKRVRSVAQVRPPYTIDVSGLRGSLGQALARRLGRSDKAPLRGVARFALTGKLELGSASCHLPFWRSDSVEGTLSLAMTYRDAAGKLRCSASHALALKLQLSLRGVAACRDLRNMAAASLEKEVRAQARRVTGYAK